MRRKCQGNLRIDGGEHRAMFGKGIEVGCLDGFVSVCAEVIGTKRVNGDYDHRRLGRGAERDTQENECETIRVQIDDRAPQQLSIDSFRQLPL